MKDQELIEKSLAGDKKSLEALVASIQSLVFNLCLRFLWDRLDAEDATQEILIKIITNLSKFKGQSKFKTYAYRIATNYLITLKKTNSEGAITSFDMYAEDLQTYKGPVDYNLPDKGLLEQEMKIGCTLAMLQCLNREHRIAFILGSILKLKSKVGAEITQTSPENFRKRLEKARKLLSNFLKGNCGVYNPSNKCRCSNRIATALVCGRIDQNNMNFTKKINALNEEMEELSSLSNIYQNHGAFQSNSNFLKTLEHLIASKQIMQ